MEKEGTEKPHFLQGIETQQQNTSKPGSFTLFPHLPPEVRQYIWELTLPQRTIRIIPYDFAHSGSLNPEYVGGPVISQICRESRHMALRHASFELITLPDRWFTLWLDRYRDILEITASTPILINSLVKQAGNVLLRINSLDSSFVSDLLRDRQFRENVHTIYLQEGNTVGVHESELRQPGLTSPFFVHDQFEIVDLHNDKRIEWFSQVLENNKKPSNASDTEMLADYFIRRKHLDGWAAVKRKFMKAWFSHGEIPSPVASSEDGSLKPYTTRVPRIRLVRCLSLIPKKFPHGYLGRSTDATQFVAAVFGLRMRHLEDVTG